jgi:hypothetical protein
VKLLDTIRDMALKLRRAVEMLPQRLNGEFTIAGIEIGRSLLDVIERVITKLPRDPADPGPIVDAINEVRYLVSQYEAQLITNRSKGGQ